MQSFKKIGISLLTCTMLASISSAGALADTNTGSNDIHITATHQVKEVAHPVISRVYMVHYNTVRMEYQTPISSKDNVIAVGYGPGTAIDSIAGGQDVFDSNGDYTGYDINLDELARYTTKEERNEIADTLKFNSINTNTAEQEFVPIDNAEIKDKIRNATDLGQIDVNTNFIDMSTVTTTASFDKYLSGPISADHTLGNQITTLTNAIGIYINPGYDTGYTYKTTDAEGNEVHTFAMNDFLFIQPEGSLKNEKYTVSVQKDGETQSTELLTFTPFHIF